jgi:fermentation-respiration switch protein FrsA (DUF1100 family)
MRVLYNVLTAAAIVYVALAVLLYLFQNRMVFLANMPGRALTATPGDAGMAFEDVQFAAGDGTRLHGWYIPADAPRGTVLFFHGNAGNISHRLDSIAIFHALGLDVFIFDYRGYGRSAGRPGESGTYQDARGAWDYLVGERGIDPRGIVIFGRSLGGAVGAWLAAREQPAAVILESCFSSAEDMARRLYPFMPVKLITRLHYPVVEYAAGFRNPLLVVHSRDDEIIPFRMGQAIHAAAPGPKALLEIHGDHNNGFIMSQDRYVPALDTFISRYLGVGSNHPAPP